jgi:hypothetical protein
MKKRYNQTWELIDLLEYIEFLNKRIPLPNNREKRNKTRSAIRSYLRIFLPQHYQALKNIETWKTFVWKALLTERQYSSSKYDQTEVDLRKDSTAKELESLYDLIEEYTVNLIVEH